MNTNNISRKDASIYLKEFIKKMPRENFWTKQSAKEFGLNKKENDISNLYDKGVLINSMAIDKNSISTYKKTINKVKQFPQELKPDNMLENEILQQTRSGRNTRRILFDSVREQDEKIIGNYDKMVAHYLLIGGDRPVERFSKVEMSMKQYGLRPNLGSSIMKYGDNLTTKLEELAREGRKSPQEWEEFKNQVLHGFNIAEAIGNRNVNTQEHEIWEERLVRLGILERKIEKPNQETLRESVKVDLHSDKSPDKPSARDQQGILLDSSMQQRAQRAYQNTGAIPLGYKLGEDGKTVVSIASQVGVDKKVGTSRNKLSANGKKTSEQQTIR